MGSKDKPIEEYSCYETLKAAKEYMEKKTNIASIPELHNYVYSFLYECYLLGWLKQFDNKPIQMYRRIVVGQTVRACHYTGTPESLEIVKQMLAEIGEVEVDESVPNYPFLKLPMKGTEEKKNAAVGEYITINKNGAVRVYSKKEFARHFEKL